MSYNTRNDLQKHESDVLKRTKEESPEIGWYYEFYKGLQQIISIIPKERNNEELPENPAIFLLLMTTSLKIMQTSNSILNLISKGYYHQGMILLRSIQEEFHHLLFFTFYPKNYIKQWREQKIRYKHINKFMNKSDYIPKRWKSKDKTNTSMYEVLSSYVHPSIDRWSSILSFQKEQQEVIIKLLPRYEKNSFNTVFSGVMLYLANTITLLMEKYKIDIKEASFWEDMASKLDQFDLEYFQPLIELMKSEYDTRLIG